MKAHLHTATIVLIAWVLIGSKQCAAQQDPMYDQYMFNVLAFNPAYAGSADVFTIMALSRHQWVGFEGAPSTQTLVAHTPLRSQALSLGLSFMTDKIGPSRRTSFHADLAYRIRVNEESELAFGLKGGIDLHQAELSTLTTVNADPANVDMKGQLLPNFGFGLFWHSERYYVGLSAPKLPENELEIATSTGLTTALQERHYCLIGAYVFDLNEHPKL